MGSVAGARRTDSSFPIYLASTNPSSIMVPLGSMTLVSAKAAAITRVFNAMAHLPHVEHAATTFGFDGNIDLQLADRYPLRHRPG